MAPAAAACLGSIAAAASTAAAAAHIANATVRAERTNVPRGERGPRKRGRRAHLRDQPNSRARCNARAVSQALPSPLPTPKAARPSPWSRQQEARRGHPSRSSVCDSPSTIPKAAFPSPWRARRTPSPIQRNCSGALAAQTPHIRVVYRVCARVWVHTPLCVRSSVCVSVPLSVRTCTHGWVGACCLFVCVYVLLCVYVRVCLCGWVCM